MSEKMEPVVLDRKAFSAQWLMDHYPPIWRHPHKQLVFDLACPAGTRFAGTLEYSRWKSAGIEDVPAMCDWELFEPRPDVYDYQPHPVLSDAVPWHVNFADPILFVAYGSGLFAQDEIQVAEHPTLGALVEALASTGGRPLTIESGQPTPVLVRGAARYCRVATDVNVAAGRPHGLYGNRFASASQEAIRRATLRIDPPTETNLIAVAALSGGYGAYTRDEIAYVLQAAYTGFRAAVLASAGKPAIIHSGFWGCGAFGGNRHLMTLLQAIAAGMAGVDRLVFHTFDQSGMDDVAAAKRKSRELFAGSDSVLTGGQVIEALAAQGFMWGVSDGN